MAWLGGCISQEKRATRQNDALRRSICMATKSPKSPGSLSHALIMRRSRLAQLRSEPKRCWLPVQLEQRVREEIPHAWQRIIEEPNEILIELVQEEVQDELGERPSERQVREELLAIFKRERSPIIAEPRQENPSRPLAPTTQSPAQTTSRQRGNRPKVQVREFRLWEQTYQVRFQYEVLTRVADAMYDRHKDDFAKVLQLSRFHDERGKCTIPHRIGDSEYFVDRNLDFEKMKLTCERLLEHFGYSADDLDIVTED